MRQLLIAFLFLAILLAPAGYAQTGAGTGLSGTVTDPSGAAIAGAVITIERTDTGEKRTVTTDATGTWEARFLSVGDYRVTAQAGDFQTLTLEGIAVSTGEVASLPMQLSLGQQTETVTVTADAGMVSRNSSAIVLELDSRELEAADLVAQLHAASRHRARRIGRHQRVALQRQRVDLAQRQRRSHHQQQLRLQRRRRHQPALLQQPHQRQPRHDRRRRRHALAQHRACAWRHSKK